MLSKILVTSWQLRDIDSLFTNVPIEETIEICKNNLFKNRHCSWFEKSEFKDLLPLATKKSYFTFNNIVYKQIDGVVTGSFNS